MGELISYEQRCSNCKFGDLPLDAPVCEKCEVPYFTNFQPEAQQTNADRIRVMSDEELAEWIVHKTEGNGFDGYEQIVLAWLKWLKSPAEEADE